MHSKYFQLTFSVLFYINIIATECRRVKRVIGGTEIECGVQPRVASLRNITDFRHLCGATLITPRFALTAAHCVHHSADNYVLQLNNYCLHNTTEKLPKAHIVEIIAHKLYDRHSRTHDIALLRINLDLDNVTWLNTTILPKSSFGISGECYIYGYGVKSVNTNTTSEKLNGARLEIISLDRCLQLLGQYMAPAYDSGMICALGENADSCQGDSGGPLICKRKLQGVSSYGLSCGVPNVPGVYTGIGSHLKWIDEVIGTK